MGEEVSLTRIFDKVFGSKAFKPLRNDDGVSPGTGEVPGETPSSVEG